MAANKQKFKKAIEKSIANEATVKSDAEIARLKGEVSTLRSKYKLALQQIDAVNHRAETIAGLQGLKSKPLKGSRKRKPAGDATAIMVLSDWHIEETVDPATVSGRNEYSLKIAEKRAAEVTRRAMLLIEHEQKLTKINHVVIAALGDWITGDIHEDASTSLAPLAATRKAGEMLLRTIDAVSQSFPQVTVVTCTGNHGRSTKQLRISSDREYSYEQNLYLTLEGMNRSKNVRYQVGEGYHNWLSIDGYKVRFHHGHAIRSNGAIGGISISANKAIAQWNRMERADLDIFGHHHQFSWNYGRFVSNGSLIGWNPFANFIKAEWQPPAQSLCIIDRDRGCTKAVPIFCEEAK